MIKTERLILRPHRLEDFVQSAQMWGDAVVARHIGGRPSSEEEVWARLLRYAGHWALLGFGYWVVEDRATGAFLGEVGFAEGRRDITPSIKNIPELGWAFAAHAHGKGYATEAARAAISWGKAHFGPVRTVCIIHPANVPSIRVAEKCGYRKFQIAIYRGEPTLLYERPES